MAVLLKNSFIENTFNYSPLLWMFCKKSLYKRISKIHHKALKIVYQKDQSYEDLLTISKTKSIHQKHLFYLTKEIYKTLNNLNPDFMGNIFEYKNLSYALRRGVSLKLPPCRSQTYGVNSIHFRGCMIWNHLPFEIKNSCSLNEFKKKIRLHGNIDCSCHICR